MVATRVGYAGGDQVRPTYHAMGGHREAVEVTYDPSRLSYRDLLDIYWGGQPNTIPPGPARTRLAVMPRGAAQLADATASKNRLERATGETVHVDVLPEARFWAAERLHQKFHLQRTHPLLVAELAAAFPDLDTFLATTAAARLNAYLDSYRDVRLIEDAAHELGQDPDELRRRLDAIEPRSNSD